MELAENHGQFLPLKRLTEAAIQTISHNKPNSPDAMERCGLPGRCSALVCAAAD